jgi:hypothetical protein
LKLLRERFFQVYLGKAFCLPKELFNEFEEHIKRPLLLFTLQVSSLFILKYKQKEQNTEELKSLGPHSHGLISSFHGQKSKALLKAFYCSVDLTKESEAFHINLPASKTRKEIPVFAPENKLQRNVQLTYVKAYLEILFLAFMYLKA